MQIRGVGFWTCLIFTLRLAAQTASIQGIVKDQSDAAVVGAVVMVTNLDTGLKREATSNETGLYTFPSLPVGRYTLRSTTKGFSVEEVTEIKLDVGQTARVDFTLKPGTVTESVNVTASATLLNSETSMVGQVVENKRIVEMPLNGRNYLELARTSGVTAARGSRPQSEGVFSAGGQHGYQVQVNIDGVDNSLTYSGGPIGFEAQAVKPSVDAVGEFRVVTNNLSAEYGNRMGGQVFVNIKSGTNSLHGTLFEFLRNSDLDGTNFFANRVGSPKPAYKQNQFGGTVGRTHQEEQNLLLRLLRRHAYATGPQLYFNCPGARGPRRQFQSHPSGVRSGDHRRHSRQLHAPAVRGKYRSQEPVGSAVSQAACTLPAAHGQQQDHR